MRFSKRSAVVAAAVGVVVGLGGQGWAAVVFSDTFGSSSLNGTSNPTNGNTTSYDVASTKGQSPASTIASGHLKFGMAATTSGVDEVQAKFATTPVTLVTPGDSVTLTLTFTNTQNLLVAGTSSALYLGLYDSAGTTPATGLQSSGLNATAGSPNATGHAASWQGYVSRITPTGGSNQVYTRPVQNGGGVDSSANQDLVGNGAGGGLYTNPVGSVIGGNQTSTVSGLTTAGVYTNVLTLTLNADSSIGIASALYQGAGTGGTQLWTESTSHATPLSLNFDGLAFGYRSSGTSLATGMDVNQVTVEANIQPAVVPEPTMLGVAAAPTFLLGRRRRRG